MNHLFADTIQRVVVVMFNEADWSCAGCHAGCGTKLVCAVVG